MKAALIQLKTTDNYQENFERARKLITEVKGADIVVLPEAFLFPFGTSVTVSSEEISKMLEELARLSKAVLIAGTVPEITEDGVYNTCYVFDKAGNILGKYRKIHMYDVNLPGLYTCESDTYKSGEDILVVDTPQARIGVVICFDLRFPELFIKCAEKGAEIIVVPAAFSYKTGPDHWKLLLKARALDSQCFVAGCAPAQNGELSFPVYGHSFIAGPYGEKVAEVDGEEQILVCEFDPKSVEVTRRTLPVLSARRPDIYSKV